jgi:hydrogenase maturation protease
MANVLIVGFGSRLRSDDGLGFRAAEELSRSMPDSGNEIRACHQLTPELAESISHAETVLFIDASRVGRPGEIRCVQVNPCHPDSPFAHQLTPETLLFLCRDLYGVCPKAFTLSLCGENFGLGDELSSKVAAALPDLMEYAKSFLAGLRGLGPVDSEATLSPFTSK